MLGVTAGIKNAERACLLVQGMTFMTLQITSLGLTDARRMITAGEQQAERLGIPHNLAVVGSGGNLITHVRMDGAWLGSIDIVVGAAGASGGTVEQDQKVLEAAVAAFGDGR
jgi:uncharacterized protein GlcG (DUF336 family)